MQKYLEKLDTENERLQQAKAPASRKTFKQQVLQAANSSAVPGGPLVLPNERLTDYILRLKTTSINNEKLAETLEILNELLKSELDAASKDDRVKLDGPDSLQRQLGEAQTYRFLLRAFGSRNPRVVAQLYPLIATIGDLGERVDQYIQEGALKAMVKIYRTSDDWAIKRQTVNFFIAAFRAGGDTARQVASVLGDHGLTITMASDFVKFSGQGRSQHPAYLHDLLLLMVAAAAHPLGHTSYMSSEFATGLQELINSGNIELVVQTLDLVGALTEDPAYRKHLSSKETFSHIVKLLMRALKAGDRDLRLASACLRGVAHFAREKPNLMILVNLHGQINLFAVLCRAFHGGGFREHLATDEEYSVTRLSAGMIANNIAVGAQVDGLGGLLIKEGIIDAMAAVIMDGPSVGEAVFVAHKLITQLAEYVDSAVEKYEVLVGPLVASLSPKDGKGAALALAAM